MEEFNNLINSFSIGGYRSFGSDVQRFRNLSKVNLFIGKNNSGKSNILRFICGFYPEVFSNSFNSLKKSKNFALSDLDRHKPLGARFSVGIAIPLDSCLNEQSIQFYSELSKKLSDESAIAHVLFQLKARFDNSDGFVWIEFGEDLSPLEDDWRFIFNNLTMEDNRRIQNSLTDRMKYSEGDFALNILKGILPVLNICTRCSQGNIQATLIPAIRSIGNPDTTAKDFSGEGIIGRIAALQHPVLDQLKDRDKYNSINSFLQNVTDNPTARIEIPHDQGMILVDMDQKTLPLDSLGTGIHEVIILAAAATMLENTVICMEEPELHLNPILQKKLVRYLATSTNNQYFITTHSAALMDTPGAEIYHICLENGQSIAERVTSDNHRSAICEDLGYHPSDLLQANCVIWVEGPSDRIYLNYWIHELDSTLIEGIHYSIMFYGGRLLSHLSGNDIDDELLEDFISLRRLNRRGVILIDSDRKVSNTRINDTKKRLKEEFDKGPGYAWITSGREIENYLPPDCVEQAIKATTPSAKTASKFGRYENTLSITTKGGKSSQASKTEVARYIAKNCAQDFTVLDLEKQIKKLIGFIRESNPGVEIK
jgi:predicted ATPase